MKLNLLSCTAPRPDKRAITNCINEISVNVSPSLASELTEILLEGDAVDIVLTDKNTASALRSLRKLDIDYEILD